MIDHMDVDLLYQESFFSENGVESSMDAVDMDKPIKNGMMKINASHITRHCDGWNSNRTKLKDFILKQITTVLRRVSKGLVIK